MKEDIRRQTGVKALKRTATMAGVDPAAWQVNGLRQVIFLDNYPRMCYRSRCGAQKARGSLTTIILSAGVGGPARALGRLSIS
jgi:hypothetical protein